MRLASFEAIIGALHGAEVRYLIAGGLAVGAHGYLRSTHDVDLVAQRVAENIERLFGALQDLGYRPGAPVAAQRFANAAGWEDWIGQNSAAVLELRSDRHPETPVNVFAAESFCFEDEYEKALVKPLHGSIPVRFVCIDTLIRMKEASGRLADLADAEQLRLTLKVDEPLDLEPGEIDWGLGTWDGSRREQLRYWAGLPVENAVAALEEMEEITERFRGTTLPREVTTTSSPAVTRLRVSDRRLFNSRTEIFMASSRGDYIGNCGHDQSPLARQSENGPRPRVPVLARRLRDLKVAPEDSEIEAIEPIERTARVLRAPELSSIQSDGNEQ